MEQIRKPFQGTLNIIRFNWHFYIIAFAVIFFLLFISNHTNSTISMFLALLTALISITIIISLLVSYFIYDLSGFYKLKWINDNEKPITIININAGFDETSILLKSKFKNATFIALDFYNPEKHTEISIKRARKIYPPFPNTIQIDTSKINIENNTLDKVFVILSAHEIRDEKERITFFKELNRILKPKGEIFVTEHLRDLPNFIAYNIGAFHFFSKSSWKDNFNNANLIVKSESKQTPFISTFILKKNGNTL